MIVSSDSGESVGGEQALKLKKLYELSDKRYDLVGSPETADVILIADLQPEIWMEHLIGSRLVNEYTPKCFLLNEDDQPLAILHGIYAAGRKSFFSASRVRTGSYALYPTKFLNPFVLEDPYSSREHLTKQYLLTFVGRGILTVSGTPYLVSKLTARTS
jgi:hypothetical protein